MKIIKTAKYTKKCQIETENIDDLAYDVYSRIHADRNFDDLALTDRQN